MATKTNGHTEGHEWPHRGSGQTDFGLRAVKTYDNVKSRDGHEENSWEATKGDAEDYKQEGTTARNRQMDDNAEGHAKETYIPTTDRLQSEGCEDKRHVESRARREKES